MNWYKFTAFNSQSLYGYGRAKEVYLFCDHLNRNRVIDLYVANIVENAERVAELEAGDGGFDLHEALGQDDPE